MTSPDDRGDDPGKGVPEGQTGPDLPLDEDAVWRAIVENYGERPALTDDASPEPPAPAAPAHDPFDRSYLDAVAPPTPAEAVESWSDEGHFVPPEPPPVPQTTPGRRLAWIGLFGAPLLMLLAVVGSWTYPTWFAMCLVAGFVGGFVFLVATMEHRGGDGGGDDGAVV